jgi:aminoglycoside phosphotransferase (APT) family kinase protein
LPGPYNFSHREGLTNYDAETRHAIDILKNRIDADAVIEIWKTALTTRWENPPVWVHGDISAGNLLVKEGKLSAVIDFGGLAVGNPACNLVIAWKFFRSKSRETFRAMLPLDAGTWARGRAWALWKALIIAAGLTETNVVEATQAWPTIHEVLEDYRREI